MPRKKKEPSRAANGSGSIRKKTVKRNGKTYEYWEARCTTGFDPGTGKQIQRSISGKTQQEVARKLRELSVEVDTGTYVQPSALTLTEWMSVWLRDYLTGIKPSTAYLYRREVESYIVPHLGAVRLSVLNAGMIQRFYNELLAPT